MMNGKLAAATLDPGVQISTVRRRRKILIVTNQIPGHEIGLQHSGHARYFAGFLERFSKGGSDVLLIVLRPNIDFFFRDAASLNATVVGPEFRTVSRWVVLRSPAAVARLVAWKVYERLPRFAQNALDKARVAVRKASGFTHRLGTFPSPQEVAYVREAAATFDPDIVMYDGIFNSCGRLNARQHWVITHEVKYQRAKSFAQNGVSVTPASFTSETERDILEEAGNVIAVQWDDAREFKRLTAKANVITLPNTLPLPALSRKGRAILGRCLFVASGSYHNLHGIRWFLDECWPKIRAAAPEATLDIVGSVCFRLSADAPGVRLRGVIDDLSVAYDEAAVTIVPLLIGSGLKVKLIEALGREQAVVTTAVGAQGLMDFSPRPFAVGDTSDAFADATVKLLGSPAAQLELRAAAGQAAHAFKPETGFADLEAAISSNLLAQ